MRILNLVSTAGRFAGLGAVALTLTACSMGNMFGGGAGDNPAPSSQFANVSASQTEIAQAAPNALPAIATECPPIKVRLGGEAIYSYGGAKAGDASKLHYQAVIEKQSRNCVVSNGLITVKMGVVGRVLLGPAGNEKTITAPVRFAVERNGTPVFSELYKIPVNITPPNQSEEFVKVIENVAIPYVGGEDIVIWVGFDPRG
jgi:hypothetical protein